ncbi:hypothetical protein [Pseudoalteromonas luteoviolacea]|uniref:Uncharacterized protein n=1 Tax=Pseudoalteromonas luteoviolacea S4054 TaxID=1129367 RepID=A0A0F6AHB7_9GAMM|nr:hypothetical protein [Pseudoalteromonas luteoviolacea]AOT08402.1 flagellin [Pseudoalteromonas luteoviolacea]AOT13318.1 flagellin [Pseudoalteromonas luteoviolacea]AOT18231.1 flagellin [Pseudoalteromonas luteoviolacea]KKE84784.1 hypothetical protein N479_00935 [Pseudoalteromonas luteoviolacea S4054]KZN76043.1 hypothetical protein N481_06750 [Pseudoalteromonas luteoviolacea S4047-1]
MTKVHDNNFTFNLEGLSSVSFEVKDYNITQGQPFDGVTCDGRTLTVKAGRHNSSEVADWFKARINIGGIAKTYSSHSPSSLNFAVTGTLTLNMKNGVTYTFDDFVLGQGHFASSNNWWIGSKYMVGVTWSNVDQQYAIDLVSDTLSLEADIITEDPVGAVLDSAKLIVDILNNRQVGSGSITARTSESTTAVELFLFQMDNSDTNINMTGLYKRP